MPSIIIMLSMAGVRLIKDLCCSLSHGYTSRVLLGERANIASLGLTLDHTIMSLSLSSTSFTIFPVPEGFLSSSLCVSSQIFMSIFASVE